MPHDRLKLIELMALDKQSVQIKKMQTCSLKHKSVEGVAFCKESGYHGGSLTSAHCSVTSSAGVSDGFGAGDGGSGGEQFIKLSLGEGIRQDKRPVLHATSAKNNGGQDFIDCGGRLEAAHVGGGAVDAGNGH